MASKLDILKANLEMALNNRLVSITELIGELTVIVRASEYIEVAQYLRDDPRLHFEQLIDLCGVDYQTYGGRTYNDMPRFAVVLHLLSLSNNWRIRIRVFAPDHNNVPIIPSVIDIWNSANWYEREAFDLYGIVFEGHPDLRRILTDYGFIGHPFRKDFPISGHVEMYYNSQEKRVAYQAVTIDPREITPRVISRGSL